MAVKQVRAVTRLDSTRTEKMGWYMYMYGVVFGFTVSIPVVPGTGTCTLEYLLVAGTRTYVHVGSAHSTLRVD